MSNEPQRSIEECMSAWTRAPLAVRSFVTAALEKEIGALRQQAAERSFSNAIVTTRIAQSIEEMAKMAPGGNPVGAAVAEMSASITQDSPADLLAEYVDVAKQLLHHLADAPKEDGQIPR